MPLSSYCVRNSCIAAATSSHASFYLYTVKHHINPKNPVLNTRKVKEYSDLLIYYQQRQCLGVDVMFHSVEIKGSMRWGCCSNARVSDTIRTERHRFPCELSYHIYSLSSRYTEVSLSPQAPMPFKTLLNSTRSLHQTMELAY